MVVVGNYETRHAKDFLRSVAHGDGHPNRPQHGKVVASVAHRYDLIEGYAQALG